MNAQLQKHLRLCNRNDRADEKTEEPEGWRQDPSRALSWRRAKRWRRWCCDRFCAYIAGIDQASSAYLHCGALVALPSLYCIWSDRERHRTYSTNNNRTMTAHTTLAFVILLLVGSMFLLAAARIIGTRLERRRLERARALHQRIYQNISKLLGSIGATPMILGDRRRVRGDSTSNGDWLGDCVEEDANAFVRFVQAESESLQCIAGAIQAIETTTRFFYGAGTSTMASRRSSNVLPNLRHQVHALLRSKLHNLEHLRSALSVSIGNNEEDIKANPVEDDVITISRLRVMKKEAAQLLSETCERVLFTPGAASCLSRQKSLLDRLRFDCEGVSAYLQHAMKSSSLSGQADSSALIDMSSSLHLALVSLHQQQMATNDMDDHATKARFLLQWQAISRQARLLFEHIDDHIMASTTRETTRDEETDEDGTRESTTLACGDDNNFGSVGIRFPRCDDAAVVETLVYSDVADPPKPRRRPKRQGQPENGARKIQPPSPFDLVEELQIRLQMMSVPEERPAVR
jgi:hypothetical protein